MAAETIRSAGTIRPSRALVNLWDKGADPAEARRQYEQLTDDVRAVINLWATFGPNERAEIAADFSRIRAVRNGQR